MGGGRGSPTRIGRSGPVIPGNFDYHRPATLDEAIVLLAELGEDARPLAGGHSLVPMMKLRLAQPTNLVDLGGIAALKGIRADGGEIVIGAMTTQHEIIASELLADRLPILRETARQIADPQVRYVGTLGGNCAGGDPGNDMPAVMQCLGATFVLEGPNGATPGRRPGFLRGRVHDRARAGRDPVRGPGAGAGEGPRLRLRQDEAQGRRLRDRGRGRDPDHGRRALHSRQHRADQPRRDPAPCRRLPPRRWSEPRSMARRSRLRSRPRSRSPIRPRTCAAPPISAGMWPASWSGGRSRRARGRATGGA